MLPTAMAFSPCVNIFVWLGLGSGPIESFMQIIELIIWVWETAEIHVIVITVISAFKKYAVGEFGLNYVIA